MAQVRLGMSYVEDTMGPFIDAGITACPSPAWCIINPQCCIRRVAFEGLSVTVVGPGGFGGFHEIFDWAALGSLLQDDSSSPGTPRTTSSFPGPPSTPPPCNSGKTQQNQRSAHHPPVIMRVPQKSKALLMHSDHGKPLAKVVEKEVKSQQRLRCPNRGVYLNKGDLAWLGTELGRALGCGEERGTVYLRFKALRANAVEERVVPEGLKKAEGAVGSFSVPRSSLEWKTRNESGIAKYLWRRGKDGVHPGGWAVVMAEASTGEVSIPEAVFLEAIFPAAELARVRTKSGRIRTCPVRLLSELTWAWQVSEGLFPNAHVEDKISTWGS